MEPQNVQATAAATTGLVGDIRVQIGEARAGLATTVNSALTMLYWRIGRRIRAEVLQGERAGYGEQIVAALARQLEADHGRGFGAKNLRHMLRFGEVFEAEEIVYALSRQLSWTHLRSLIYIDDPLKREFYLEMCRTENWSTRTLQGRIDSMLFERTALSRKPDELLELDQSGIHVAEYLTGLPPRQLLEQKLHEAVTLSRARLKNRPDPAGIECE